MKRALLGMVFLCLGCDGSWSNNDLLFASALPRSGDLQAQLPNTMVSEPNPWPQTREAANDFNTLLGSLLGLVEQVRQISPSIRAASSRTWGPFGDSNNPGREVQVVMDRTDEHTFVWRVDSRALNAEFVTMISGTHGITESARLGQGTITAFVKDFRDVVKVDDNLKQLDQIDITYVTDGWPREVDLRFTLKADSSGFELSPTGYMSRAQQDGSGSFRFGAQNSTEVTARWDSTGSVDFE